jgi:tetratricopeptide (TPR) repeat protein
MEGSQRLDELRQKFHENPRRYFAPLANEYRKAGDPEQAIAICRAHLAQQPGHMSGHVVYGQALYDAHRIDEARGVFEKALSLDPDNAIVLRQLGDIARQKGETAEARHWYARALDADPQDHQTAAYIAELTEPITEAAATDVETPLPVPAQEPEIADVHAVAEEKEKPPALLHEEEIPWRKTPPHGDAPFVTRTMAEVYARQGHHEAALDVYRQLAMEHPDDTEIRGRIEELAGGRPEEPGAPDVQQAAGSPPPEPPDTTPIDVGTAEGEPEVAEPSSAPEPEPSAEPSPESAAAAAAAAAADPFNFVELSDAVYVPSSEDLNLEPEPEALAEGVHFTEREIHLGDTWKPEDWAAGLSDEGVELSFDSPGESLDSNAPAPVQDVVAESSGETPPAHEEGPTVEPEAAAEPAREEREETAPVPEEPHLVAYSPQPPEEHELPHYEPKGPTVREFFATLGTRRPPDREPRAAFTAHAVTPGSEPWPESAYGSAEGKVEAPQHAAQTSAAKDAFGGLFPDATVAEEDTRAAFALSGALGVGPEAGSLSAPNIAATPAPAAPPAAVPVAAQESEEDIRRFREWLDGLAES